MVIYGLTDYLKATGELNPNLTATVLVNDQPGAHAQDRPGHRPESAARSRSMNPSCSPASTTSASPPPAQGRLYLFGARRILLHRGQAAEDRHRLAQHPARLFPPGSRQAMATRSSTMPRRSPARWPSGDIIAVRLTVTGSEWKYLMLEDPIPAGTEFIERDNVYELRNRPPWWDYYFTRRELHDDRLAIFQTWFPAGPAAVFLSAESSQPRRVPGEPRARATRCIRPA